MILQRVLGVVAVIGAGFALAGCNNVSAGAPTTQLPTVVPESTSDTAPPTVTATTKSGSGGGQGNSSGNSGGSSGGSSGGGGKTTSSSSPPSASVTISVKKQPLCPRNGTPDAPFSTPGQDVTITWKVTGAAKAAISVDQPTQYGSYGRDYPASGELTLPFSCNNTTGKTSHTYTVWPADIKSVSKSITVSATNNPST